MRSEGLYSSGLCLLLLTGSCSLKEARGCMLQGMSQEAGQKANLDNSGFRFHEQEVGKAFTVVKEQMLRKKKRCCLRGVLSVR